MAKSKGYKMPGLNKALKTVDTLGRQMTREADADYAVALSALRAGQQGLAKQTRGLTRDLLSGQMKQTTSLSKLARAGRQQGGVVAAKQQATVSRYGGALGQSAASAFSSARAVAAGTGAVVTGAARAGRATAGIAGTVAGIAQAGVKAQRAAATYSMNQALQQRAIIDNQTLAGLTGQLYQTALQYNMQWETWKRQQEYAAKQAKRVDNSALRDAAMALPDQVPQWTVDGRVLIDAYSEEKEGDLSGFDVTGKVTEWATMNGYDPAGTEAAVMAGILRNLKSGQPTGTATENAINTLFGGLKNWDTIGPNIVGSVLSGSSVAFEARRSQEAAVAAEDGGLDAPDWYARLMTNVGESTTTSGNIISGGLFGAFDTLLGKGAPI